MCCELSDVAEVVRLGVGWSLKGLKKSTPTKALPGYLISVILLVVCYNQNETFKQI